ncbi:AfsR/SARP family transcriptional regulator [Amycolatopsis regifaucium]|uniref:Transcriptional regulator, SARP family protein n=1 Tax=Amycolatopsis regifaucium TaxID=546365 RepID=A0A154MX32_9PSEU|nr:BTAD domain-containing putative transcriptional regulator [Amycolatopsis regifaucium]KZB88019.1 transcriptional regulator, SARP family protein [Amycolatopsis regifaucium]OKA04478.1 transcriptional regulator, SARP family protein [Amycolatopsis regifaucium]SFH49897.1 DNA-binding transcriptional activator of the SARP family [Amycolatopsis regifaucium]
MAGVEKIMWVELLGEVKARAGEEEIALGPPRQRAVLAILALRANQTVSRAQLIDGVWGDAAPASVEGSVHTYIHGLRRALAVAGEVVLTRSGAGYKLVLGPQELDVSVVESKLADARGMARAGKKSASADLIGQCLALWRGIPLSGLPGPFADAERTRLSELRYQLVEERAELMLAVGRHRELVAELGEAVEAEPFREGLRAQLMLALYRSGRRADALAEFESARRLFADELGLDPGAALTDLHLRMLRSEPELDPPSQASAQARSRVPAQLPHEAPDFVGRTGELEQLAQWCSATRASGKALVISAIDGAGGIGKTTLAVRFARTVVDSYPDGQLYLDLRGFDPNRAPLSTDDALGHLLWALGGARQRSQPDALASMYRTLLSDKRVLILLDNAVSTEQVRDLLPGTSNSLVLVTSRNRLSGLVARDGARRLTLGLLTEAEALDLLRNTIGSRRIDDEMSEAVELVRLCGHLPLALRVAAEKISGRPDTSLRELVENLHAAQDRLDNLHVDDDEMTSVRSVISWSYTTLDIELARAFRLLGLVRAPSIGAYAAAALIDRPVAETEELLRTLSEQHLLEPAGNRYGFHDLIKVYADEMVSSEESPATRREASRELMVWYLHAMRGVLSRLIKDYPLPSLRIPCTTHSLPEFETRESALSWYEDETKNVVALIEHAAELGEHEIVWQLAWCTYNSFYSTGLMSEWIQVLTIALASTEKLTAPGPRARILMFLGIGNSRLGRNEVAVEYLERGLAAVREIDNDHLHSSMLANLASTLREMKRYEEGIVYAREAVQLAKPESSDYQKAGSIDALCELYVESGQPEQALPYAEIGLEAARACDAVLLEANMMVNVAHAYRDMGDMTTAMREYEATLELCTRLGDRYHEAHALLGTAELHRRRYRHDPAREYALRALNIFVELDGEESDVVREFLESLDTEAAS